MKPKAVVFDLDWTLCELKPESERNNHTGNEKPIDALYPIYLWYWHNHLILLTGRKEKYRDITEKWLHDNDYHFDEIILQTKSTADKNHVFKREQLQKIQERYDIIAVVDDNPSMIEVCRDLNITLLQVHSWIQTMSTASEKTNG